MSVMETPPKTFYHGSAGRIDRFDYQFIGQGHDQEGPGFYFSSDEEDAAAYARKDGAGGVLHSVELELRKAVPASGRISKAEIKQLILSAPNLDDTLTNWDENKDRAIKSVVASIMKFSKNPQDAFQTVWYDFYRNNPADYLREMVALGYDGAYIKKTNTIGCWHCVVFNPRAIRIVDAY